MRTDEDSTKKDFMSELLDSAQRSLKSLEGEYIDVPLRFHEEIRREAFNSYKKSLPQIKEDEKHKAEFYMTFEYAIREAMNEKFDNELMCLKKNNKLIFTSELIGEKSTLEFQKTPEFHNLSMAAYNWKFLMNKLANLIYQVDFYAFSLDSKFKDKLFTQNLKKPDMRLSYADWSYVIIFKLMGIAIESIQVSSFSKVFSSSMAKQFILLILATTIGHKANSLDSKASQLTSALSITFIASFITIFNRFLKTPLLNKLSTQQIVIYANVATESLIKLNTYMEELVYDIELRLDNYNNWILERDSVKATDELVKIVRSLENFIDNNKPNIVMDKEELDKNDITIEQYDKKWLIAYDIE